MKLQRLRANYQAIGVGGLLKATNNPDDFSPTPHPGQRLQETFGSGLRNVGAENA
jgi:hypothetical protein